VKHLEPMLRIWVTNFRRKHWRFTLKPIS
jgi:hypothetical protein